MKRKRNDEQNGVEYFDFAFSPYPGDQSWPRFKDGPEDYARYKYIDPKDPNACGIETEQETSSEDIAFIQYLKGEKKRAKNESTSKQTCTFDDWGEDFSFLSCSTALAAASALS